MQGQLCHAPTSNAKPPLPVFLCRASQEYRKLSLQAQLCRISGHNEAAGTATLEALAHGVEGAALERGRLLWDRDQQHDAILKLQEAHFTPITPYMYMTFGSHPTPMHSSHVATAQLPWRVRLSQP